MSGQPEVGESNFHLYCHVSRHRLPWLSPTKLSTYSVCTPLCPEGHRRNAIRETKARTPHCISDPLVNELANLQSERPAHRRHLKLWINNSPPMYRLAITICDPKLASSDKVHGKVFRKFGRKAKRIENNLDVYATNPNIVVVSSKSEVPPP